MNKILLIAVLMLACVSCAEPAHKYTVKEIEELQEACLLRSMYGTTNWEKICTKDGVCITPSYTARTPREKAVAYKAAKECANTYIQAGITIDAIHKEDAK